MKRILVVDDDRMECVMTKYALGEEYEVCTVQSGKEAMEFLENSQVDLILLDLMMPEMSGQEVALTIKNQDRWTGIPIVFLTADEAPMTEVECLNCGADDFIKKPFVPLVMQTRVSRILEIYELRKELELKLEKRTEQMEKATIKSLTDALTGLHNREYMEIHVSQFLEDNGTGTLFMIDMDNFKKMNDNFGHIIGDRTLKSFAGVMREHARESDMLCRLAGDEFMAFYPDLTDREAAGKKAESIIKSFSEKMAEEGYGGIVSVSIGITIAQKGADFRSIYNAADKSLYFVKNNGKNAYHFYGANNEKIEEISTDVDLEYVSTMLENGLTDQRGAFQLAFDEFKNVYDFVSRCVARKKQEVQVVLFTMSLRNKQAGVSMEETMQKWETALAESLRVVDTGTRYSNSQYMVILMDADTENGKKVAERVVENFFRSNGNLEAEVTVAYDIRTMQPVAE